MSNGSQNQRGALQWALPASVVLHLLVVALLIFGLPITPLHPRKDQSISVDLVQPPKPQKPEKEAAKRPPPAPKPAPKPESRRPPEARDDPARSQPMPVLKPVYQFGEKDAGPRKALDGEGAKIATTPSAQSEPQEEKAAAPKTLAASGSDSKVSLAPNMTGKAGPKKTQTGKELQQAKTLFSQTETGNPVAMAAMRNTPRDMRIGLLCATELRDQLEHASPPYYPEILPSYRLREGTVLDIPKAAFRVAGQWYDLSYRCQTDAEVTKVVYFAFRVGDTIPQAEWAGRRLPTQ